MKNFTEYFTDIYNRNLWFTGSGGGSTPSATVSYRYYVENFIKDKNIKTVVDFGCGDWQFSKEMNWDNIEYAGYDCVKGIIDCNTENYSKQNIKFNFIENLDDFFIKGDLLLIKDVFQHWDNDEVVYFLTNIKSNFKFVLITNSCKQTEDNQIGLNDRSLSAKYNPLKQFNAIIVERYSIKKMIIKKMIGIKRLIIVDEKEISLITNI
jgi:2-polyprenyl-3-methyl-5-hydroxy-6-metoxy-1,4-benzoquinol methylase